MPNRIIRESALTSLSLDALSGDAERFFWRLVLVADDFGRFEADPRVLLAKCFPLKIARIKIDRIARWWAALVSTGAVKPYRVGDKIYGYFPSWSKHQKVRAKTSKFPAPCQQTLADANICEQTLADVSVVGVGVGDGDVIERTTLSGSGPTFLAPESSPTRNYSDEARDVLRWLNLKTGKNFEEIDTHLKLIAMRLREGRKPWQLKAVVSRRAELWRGNPEMQPYLRPSTIFNKTKFAQYIGELPKSGQQEITMPRGEDRRAP